MDISLLCGAGYIWISGKGKESLLRIAFGSPGRKAIFTGFSWQRTFHSMYSIEKAAQMQLYMICSRNFTPATPDARISIYALYEEAYRHLKN